MAGRTSKLPQRSFPWRETFLAALRQESDVKVACKAAGISRNSAYAHYRRYARFRRQWEHALTQGEDAAYQLDLKQLAADPEYQRAAMRALERLRLAYGRRSWPYLALKNLLG
jgi:hypothetical protein